MMLGLVRKGKLVRVVSGRCMSSSSRCRSAAVLSFGDSSHGALGLTSSAVEVGDDAYEPTEIAGLPSDVCSIGAGHYHSLAVTAQGELWAWGRNNEAQLGRGVSAPRDSWNEPRRVQGLSEVRVRAAYASGVISTAIGDDGSLWVWGKSKRGQLGLGKGIAEAVVPSRVKALAGEEIVKVSLGWGHAMAQTKDGKVFGWGYSADGRLGRIGTTLETTISSLELRSESSCSSLDVAEKLVLQAMEEEKNMPIIWEPCLVEELHEFSGISDVACGFDHSLLLCFNGTLLSCGNNAYGQLGRGGVTEELGVLGAVDMSFRPLSIASGLGHSLAICNIPPPSEQMGETTGILSWGWNLSSQLGRPGPENTPLVVEGLTGETPVSVSGGRTHSIALTSGGGVWVWGCGKNGRLGLGSSADEAEPTLIECLEGDVVQVVSGFDHNLVLVMQ